MLKAKLAKGGITKQVFVPPFTVSRVTDGFAFGEGNISAGGEDPKILDVVDETIHSPAILVPVESEDDGCSDGREVILAYTAKEILKKSLNRAKVFGGAVAMRAAILIGLGLAENKSLNQVFYKATDTLAEKGINFGAHTDELHKHKGDCGCGAIDRAPEAMVASLKYEVPIRRVIDVLGLDSVNLDIVFTNFRAYVRDEMANQSHYSGQKVIDRIVTAGKVVKQLGGEHKERRIVLNQVRGYTINQRLIRMVTGGQAQIFAVDIWRLEDIASKSFPGQGEQQEMALLSELVYTLAVAAVLTKGDLPVDMIQDVNA